MSGIPLVLTHEFCYTSMLFKVTRLSVLTVSTFTKYVFRLFIYDGQPCFVFKMLYDTYFTQIHT
jgi:hypothetical protein